MISDRSLRRVQTSCSRQVVLDLVVANEARHAPFVRSLAMLAEAGTVDAQVSPRCERSSIAFTSQRLCSFVLTATTAGAVLTPSGSKAIELFEPGDEILSKSEHNPNGEVSIKLVEEVFVRQSVLMRVMVWGRVIDTTGEHPFYVKDRGWVPALTLCAGECLISRDNTEIIIDEVIQLETYATVYNLRGAEYHTYFVGCDEWGFSVWVHNANYRIEVDAATGS